MNELHTMPIKLEALFSSLDYRAMKWDEKGAYLVLLCEGWLKGGLIKAQACELEACLSGINKEDFERIKKNVIDKKFVSDDKGNIYNPQQIAIYNEVASRVEKLKNAGRKGGLSQAQGRLKAGSSIQIQIQNQNEIQSQNQTDTNITDLEEKKIVPTSAEHSSKPATIPHWKRIYFDFDAQEWKGITAEDERNWKITYPACDINGELDKMHMWLISNPGRKKKNYAAFINNWLCRQQDRGGTK